jgi:hypothetical protein
MAYVEKYRITFKNPEEEQFYVSILEDGFAGDVTNLKGNETPTYQQIDNDENAYTPIQASELLITVVDESNFSLLDLFMTGSVSDEKYKVEFYSGSNLLWIGFLDTESCNEEIIDPPRLISLRAVDGIGFLKKPTFTDENDEFQYGKETLLQCIEWCLGKTSLELDLIVAVSVFEETMDDRDVDPANEPFSQCKIHTRSFKDKNCYDVMYAICEAFCASLYQVDGCWKIERKHDKWNDRLHTETIYQFPYTADTPTSNTYTYRTTDFVPIGASHLRTFLPPFKSCKTVYDYVIPPDIPRNSKFTEGVLIPLLSDADNEAYTISHWDLVKNIPEVASTATPYRNDEFDPVSDKLLEQTVRIPRDVSGTANGNRLRSTVVEVNAGDRVAISAETRTEFYYDAGSQYFNVFYVRFVGVSSTIYTLQDQGNDLAAPNDQCTWQTGTGATVQFVWPPSADSDVYHSFNCRSAPFPEDGDLYVYLMGWDSLVNSNITWFKNVKVEFQLFMGAATNLNGEQALITQTSSYRGEGDFKITLGDSPKKLASGALFRGSDDYELTTLWFQQGYAESGQKLLQLSNRAHFQLQCRFKTKVDGNIKGIVYPHPGGGNTVLSPATELVYAPTTMSGTKYISTNLTLSHLNDTATVYLMEFYNDDEEENPTGDTETLTYIYG